MTKGEQRVWTDTGEERPRGDSAFPDRPGVYLMRDRGGEAIYVGKAKSLRKRIASYFSGDKDVKTRMLVRSVADIEW